MKIKIRDNLFAITNHDNFEVDELKEVINNFGGKMIFNEEQTWVLKSDDDNLRTVRITFVKE